MCAVILCAEVSRLYVSERTDLFILVSPSGSLVGRLQLRGRIVIQHRKGYWQWAAKTQWPSKPICAQRDGGHTVGMGVAAPGVGVPREARSHAGFCRIGGCGLSCGHESCGNLDRACGGQ